jgi:hypothetical protein
MSSLWFRLAAVLVLWLIASVGLFHATLQFPFFYGGAWFYVACAAIGILGLIIAKVDWVATIMSMPLLAVASFILVIVLRLGYFGL